MHKFDVKNDFLFVACRRWLSCGGTNVKRCILFRISHTANGKRWHSWKTVDRTDRKIKSDCVRWLCSKIFKYLGNASQSSISILSIMSTNFDCMNFCWFSNMLSHIIICKLCNCFDQSMVNGGLLFYLLGKRRAIFIKNIVRRPLTFN